MLVYIHLQLLLVGILGGMDHALQQHVMGQGLQNLGKGLDLPLGILPDLTEGVLQLQHIPAVPAQGLYRGLPLLLLGGIVQQLAKDHVGDGHTLVIDGHHDLLQPRVAAVLVGPAHGGALLHRPGVTVLAAAPPLRLGLDMLAKGSRVAEKPDVLAVGIKNIHPYARQ